MKKHTLAEHFHDVTEAFWNVRTSGNTDEANLTIRFTAYGRWLNDRPLRLSLALSSIFKSKFWGAERLEARS